MAFYYFGRLPRELRNDIWALAIGHEKTTDVHVRRALRITEEHEHGQLGEVTDLVEYAMVSWPTSQSCREARNEAIRHSFIPATPLNEEPSAVLNWERLRLICPEQFVRRLVRAPLARHIVHLDLVGLIEEPIGYFRDTVFDMQAVIYLLKRLQTVTMRAAVETHHLDNVMCYPCVWFTSMNAIKQEMDNISLQTDLRVYLAPEGLQEEEWLTSDNFMYKWYFRPEDVGRIEGDVGEAWSDAFAKNMYCPATFDGEPRLMKMVEAATGLTAGNIHLAEGPEVDGDA